MTMDWGFEDIHFVPLVFRDRDARLDVDLEVIPESAYQNQLRALRRRKRTSLVVPREGGGDSDRERLRDCERERVNDQVRGFDEGVGREGAVCVEVTVGFSSSIRRRFDCVVVPDVLVVLVGREERLVMSGERSFTFVSIFSVVETCAPPSTVNAAEKAA